MKTRKHDKKEKARVNFLVSKFLNMNKFFFWGGGACLWGTHTSQLVQYEICPGCSLEMSSKKVEAYFLIALKIKGKVMTKKGF